MKNYARLFVLTLAAVFVFAACDSSGGGDPNPPRVEPVSYVSTTGSQETIELILNYSAAAAQKSPARRASALPQTGTYILKFEGAEKSRGRYQMNGTSMAFQSDGGKSFTAAVGNANEDRRAISFPDPVPLDTGGADLSIPPMKEDYSFRILGQQVVDRNGDSLGSGTITLYAMTDYSTDDWTKTDRTPLGAPVGTITNGKLKLTLPELASNAVYGFYKSRSVAYFYIDNDPKKIVCLELLKKNNNRKCMSLMYVPNVDAWKQVMETDEAGDAPNLHRGWNISQGEINEAPDDPKTLQDYIDEDYEWVFDGNPFGGTFTRYYDNGAVREELTLTPAAGKDTGTFTHKLGQESSGNYKIDFSNAKEHYWIEFTPTAGAGDKFSRYTNIFINGIGQWPYREEKQRLRFLRDDSIW